MDYDEKKYRYEYKYFCTDIQFELIQARIKNLFQLDNHVKKEKNYNVRSLYFDNYDNKCFYENENGIDPKEKYRIRIYNNDDSRICLELKHKNNGKSYKEVELISRDIVEKFLDNKIEYDKNYSKLLTKLYVLNKTELMKPVIIVEYERIPYIYNIGNIRITLDKNISSSRDIKSFFDKSISTRPIMEGGQNILEIKFDKFIPDYIYKNLQLDDLQQTAFSKYYLCRKFSL